MGSLSGIVRVENKFQNFVFDAFAIFAASLLIAFSAQISIPLIPIPFTLQTLAVLLLGATLGPKRGMLAVVVYLAEGVFGLPVFGGGSAGLVHFTGMTAGYLFGFVAAAACVGGLLQRGFKKGAALVLGSLCIYFFGALWLSFFVGLKGAIAIGVIPFIWSEVAKILVAYSLLSCRKL